MYRITIFVLKASAFEHGLTLELLGVLRRKWNRRNTIIE